MEYINPILSALYSAHTKKNDTLKFKLEEFLEIIFIFWMDLEMVQMSFLQVL